MSSVLDGQDSMSIVTGTISAGAGTSKLSFEDLVATADLPPPGQEYYAARRALWLQIPSNRTSMSTEQDTDLSPTRQRLQTLLNGPDPPNSDRVWSGVAKVWRGLNDGSRLKKPLPLPMLVNPYRNVWFLHALMSSFAG